MQYFLKIKTIGKTLVLWIKSREITRQQKLAGSLILLALVASSPIAFGRNNKSGGSVKAESSAPVLTVTPKVKTAEQTPQPTPVETQSAAPIQPSPKTQTPKRPSSRLSDSNTSANYQSQNPSEKSESTISAEQPAQSGILGYINQARARNGLVQLTYNSSLNSAAKIKSQDMLEKNYFSHTSPDGTSDFDFIKASGYIYSFAGSNIAKGKFSEQSVFDSWMNSTGHRANILNPKAREFGFGIAGSYFTMIVAAR